jgi:hypothetical protein
VTIKAIETAYKGYRFRSRLEARWAVFFDVLGVKWEYELEGFEFGDGERYLPDFFLPGFETRAGLFVEVKPQHDSDFSKAYRFAEEACVPILLAAGNPDLCDYTVAHGDGEYPAAFTDYVQREYRMYSWPDGDYGSRVKRAVFAARGARFEFGESGARR